MKSLVFDCATGETSLVDVPDVAPTVPDAVSPLQFRRALRAAGLKAAFEAHVATLNEDRQELWRFGRQIERSGPLIRSAVTAAVMSEAQASAVLLDALTYGG